MFDFLKNRRAVWLLPCVFLCQGCDDSPDDVTGESAATGLVGSDRGSRNRSGNGDGREMSGSGDELEKRKHLESKEAKEVFEVIDLADLSDETQVRLRDEMVDYLREHGARGLSSLSEHLVERWRSREISRKYAMILGEAAADLFSEDVEKHSLSELLDAAFFLGDDGKEINLVAEALSITMTSMPVEVLVAGTQELLDSPPTRVKLSMTVAHVFEEAYRHIEPEIILDQLPETIEKSSVYDEALESFVMKKYMQSPEGVQQYLDGRSEAFRDRSYYHMGRASLGSDIEVAKLWLEKIRDPEDKNALQAVIAYTEKRLRK